MSNSASWPARWCYEGQRHATPSARALLRARDYIAGHAPTRVTLADASAVAGLTPWHFSRAFRRQFGMPPQRFQLAMRVELARRMLAESVPGSEVAQRAGFADQSHLIRCFKRMTGTTPGRTQSRCWYTDVGNLRSSRMKDTRIGRANLVRSTTPSG